jgi:hypothetical protein
MIIMRPNHPFQATAPQAACGLTAQRRAPDTRAPAYYDASEYAMAGAPQVSVVRRMSRGYFKSS